MPNTSLGTIEIKLSANIDPLQTELEKANKTIQGFADKLSKSFGAVSPGALKETVNQIHEITKLISDVKGRAKPLKFSSFFEPKINQKFQGLNVQVRKVITSLNELKSMRSAMKGIGIGDKGTGGGSAGGGGGGAPGGIVGTDIVKVSEEANKVVTETNEKLVGTNLKAQASFKGLNDGSWKASVGVRNASKSMAQGSIKNLLSLQSMVGKITHYITFSFGVQLVMGLRQALTNLIGTVREFEAAIINAATVSGHLGAAFGEVTEHLMDVSIALGKNTVFAATDVAKAFYSLASAGYDVARMMEEDLIPIVNYATAMQADLDFALQSVMKTIKQFKMDFEDATEVVDAFTTVVTNTFATVDKLAEGMKYVGSIAGVMGQEVGMTAAALGILYDRGLEGGQAGQRLNMIFTKLLKPTDKAKRNLEEMGLTLDDINPRTHDLVEILYTLQAAGFDAADAATMFRARTAGTAAMLVEAADEVADLTMKIQLSGGITQTVAEKQMVSLDNQLKIMGNRAQAASLEFRRGLVPALSYLSDIVNTQVIPGMQGMANTFNSLVGILRHVKPVLTGIASVLVTIAPAMLAFYAAGKLVGMMMSETAGAALLSAAGFKTFGAAVKASMANIFILSSIMMGLAHIFPPIRDVMYALIPAVVGLSIAFKFLNAEAIKEIKLQIMRTLGYHKAIAAITAENMSVLGLTATYIKMRAIQLKEIAIRKIRIFLTVLEAAKTYLLTAASYLYTAALALRIKMSWASITSMTAQGIATGILTKLQWLLNAAMWANPVFWLIGGIALLTVGMAAALGVFGGWLDSQEQINPLTAEMNESLIEVNKAVIAHTDALKAVRDAENDLIEAEAELNSLREEGKEGVVDYTSALQKFTNAYDVYQTKLKEAAEANQDFLDASGKAVGVFRAHSEEIDNSLTATVNLLDARQKQARLDEKESKLIQERIHATNEYASAVSTYGDNSDEAASAKDELVQVENEYQQVTLDSFKNQQELISLELERTEAISELVGLDKQRFEIGEALINQTYESISLQQTYNKLLVQRDVLQRGVAQYTTVLEEKTKSFWEAQLKLLETELNLYKLQKEKPEMLKDLFEKMAEYGLLTEQQIELYEKMMRTEAELFEARMEYWDVMSEHASSLSEEERKSLGELITEYQKLRRDGLDPITAWAQAQETIGIDLFDIGFSASDIQTIWDYAEAEWAAADAAQAFHDAVEPVLDMLGDLDFGDIPADLKDIATALEGIEGRMSIAADKMIKDAENVRDSWKGFIDAAVYLWRGLQNTIDELTYTTFTEAIAKSEGLTKAINLNGGAVGLLSSLYPGLIDNTMTLEEALAQLTDKEIVATIGLIDFANSLNMDLTDLGSVDSLLGEISTKLGQEISITWGDVTEYTGSVLGDTDSLVDVMDRLNTTMLDIAGTLKSMALMQRGITDGWDTLDADALWKEWREATGFISEDMDTGEIIVNDEGAMANIDQFVEFVYETLPSEYSTTVVLDFVTGTGKTVADTIKSDTNEGKLLMGRFTGDVKEDTSTLLNWFNEQEFLFAIKETISSEEFKGIWQYNLDGLLTEMTGMEFPISVLTYIDGLEWVDVGAAGVMDDKYVSISEWCKDNELSWNINLKLVPEGQLDSNLTGNYPLDLLNMIRNTMPRPPGLAKGGIIGAQTGMITKGPQFSMIGEAGSEAVVPLEGVNRQRGLDILRYIIPRYFPEMSMQAGGVISGGGVGISASDITLLSNTIKQLEGNITNLNTAIESFGATSETFTDMLSTDVTDAILGVADSVTSSSESFKSNIVSSSPELLKGAAIGFITHMTENMNKLIYMLNAAILNPANYFHDKVILASNHISREFKIVADTLRSLIYAKTYGYQKGGIYHKPTMGVFGEAGAEALIPLEGKNKKFGRQILKNIIPSYYPDLMYQKGGVYGSTSTTTYGDTTTENFTILGPINVNAMANAGEFADELKFRMRTVARR